MAYNVKYYVEHKAYVAGNERSYTIEILQDGFSGTAISKDGWADAGVFQLEFERINREQLFEGIAQKGRLELHLAIQNDADFAILTDIFAADEDEYQLRLKEDGSIKWTGFVIPDMLSYSESGYPQKGTVVAKDLSLIKAEDFETNTNTAYARYMQVMASILNTTGLNLGVHSYNDWTASVLSTTDDYFNQAYLDKFQFQDFSSFSEGKFEPKSKLEVLNDIIPPGFIIRQYDNVWNVFDISYLATDGDSIKRYEYDSTGTKTGSTSTIDLSEDVDQVDNFLLGSSVNDHWKPIKRLRLEFNHKTAIQNILFEDEYIHTISSSTSTERAKVADTTRRFFKIGGQVEVTTDTNPGATRTGTATLLIQIDDYEYELSDQTWKTTNGTTDVSVSGSDTTLTGTFGGTISDVIPSAITESEIKIELRWASVSGETVQQVRWFNISAEIINADDVNDGASKIFRLIQTQKYSPNVELPTTIIGQGPTSKSSSAIRDLSESTLSGFKHVGGTGVSYEEFVMSNLMNLQRNTREQINANLLALYNPRNLLTYDTKNYLFLDGVLNGYECIWNGTMVELNWETGSDTFEEFVKISDSDSGTTIATSSGTGSTSDFDDRYVNEAGDTMSGDLAMGSNNITGVNRILATEIEIDGDWRFRTQNPAGVNRLFIDPLTADSNVEIFAAPSGTATHATLTIADGSNQTNYAGIEMQVTGAVSRLTSLAEGTGTIRELQIRVDGAEDLSLWTDNTKRVDILSTGETNIRGGLQLSGVDITATASELNILDGVTATTAELNITDGLTATTAELNILDGATLTTAELNQLDTNTFTSLTTHQAGISSTTGDFSGALKSTAYIESSSDENADGANFRVDTSTKDVSIYAYEVRRSGSIVAGFLTDGDMLAKEATFSSLTTHQAGITSNDRVLVDVMDTTSGDMTTLAYRFGEARGWGYNSADNRIFYNGAGGTIPFWVELGAAKFNTTLAVSNTLTAQAGATISGDLAVDTNTLFVDASANAVGIGTTTPGALLDVAGELHADAIQTSTIRTTLFKPEIVSGLSGESVFNAVSQVTAIDTAANTITFEDAVFNNGDYVAISSGNYNSKGFTNTRLNLTSAGSSTADGTQHSYTVVSGAGAETDISVGDTGVKANGNMIYVNARDDVTNGPRMEGYQNLTDFSDSPIGGGSASFNWAITPEFIFYDGMGKSVFTRQAIAGFSSGNSASSITGSTWQEVANAGGGNIDTERQTKLRFRYRKRYGIDKINVTGFAKYTRTNPDSDPDVTFDERIYVLLGNTENDSTPIAEDFYDITSTSFTEFTLTLDLSSVTNGDYVFLEVDVYATVDATGGASTNIYDTLVELREDVIVEDATD